MPNKGGSFKGLRQKNSRLRAPPFFPWAVSSGGHQRGERKPPVRLRTGTAARGGRGGSPRAAGDGFGASHLRAVPKSGERTGGGCWVVPDFTCERGRGLPSPSSQLPRSLEPPNRPAGERAGQSAGARGEGVAVAGVAAMAETEERSLDDFFAKRDKKKRKEKSSRGAATATVSSAASSNAATAAAGGMGGNRQAEGGSGAASGAAAITAPKAAPSKEEDDWKEFEQEEVDYSGLRVQSMQISEKDDDDGEKREEPRDHSEEPGSGVDKSSGPWNRPATTQNPVVETIESPEPVQSSGIYRPPGAREPRSRKAPQGPPEIYSDTQFPSLQSTAKHVDTRRDKEMEKSFEVVKHKSRGRDEVLKTQATKLQLDNQYAVLGDQ